jgi:hypothetical protein
MPDYSTASHKVFPFNHILGLEGQCPGSMVSIAPISLKFLFVCLRRKEYIWIPLNFPIMEMLDVIDRRKVKQSSTDIRFTVTDYALDTS